MENKYITGIQQIGVGTRDMRKSWDWYIEHFGIDVKILEDDTVAERMLPYTGGQPQKRHACIAVNLQGGGGFEIWQYSERKPVNPQFEIALGDLGIFAAKLKCLDVKAFHYEMKKKWSACTELTKLPDGTPCFYVRDLYNNLFQIVEQNDVYIRQNGLTGGMLGALIGVSNMDKSIQFYQDVLGYDTIVYDKSGHFDDFASLNRGEQTYRRVLLVDSNPAKGPFSEMLPKGTVELVQALNRTPRKIYEGRFWGDPGFIQICYDVQNMRELGYFCKAKGYAFTVDSCPDDKLFDMGDASGHFTYIEDPDGSLIEFVETCKIPVMKKLGWFIDLNKRDKHKPLPKFLFRVMALVSRKKSK